MKAWLAKVEVLDRFAATARPGERLRYAAAEVSPQHAAVWKRARELADDGVITLTCGGRPGAREWFANKVRAPLARRQNGSGR